MKSVRLGLYVTVWVLSLLVFCIAAGKGCNTIVVDGEELTGCRKEARSAVFVGVVAWLFSFGVAVVYVLELLGRLELSWVLRRVELVVHSGLIFIWLVCMSYTAVQGSSAAWKEAVATFGFFAFFAEIGILVLAAMYVDDYT